MSSMVRLRLAIVLVVSVCFPAVSAEAEPADFHELSPPQRSAWLDQLERALEDAAPHKELPAIAAPAAPGPWKEGYDRPGWRIDADGFVVLANGARPMGSRIFARSCFLDHSDSFRRWTSAYSQDLKTAHLVATAVTESGCSEAEALGSVDGKSTGLMQVTGETCQGLLPVVGRPAMSPKACLAKMAQDPDLSIALAAAYMTRPAQLSMTDLDPPKVAAAYNAGGLYFDLGNPWHLRSTGNHIDRFVSAYNAYLAWQKDEGAGRMTRSPAVRLSRSARLPKAVKTRAELQSLSALAKEGDTIFVGDLTKRRGDYYVFARGEWHGSLEDSEK